MVILLLRAYRVDIAKNAQRQLLSLPIRVQEQVAERIGLLGVNPDNPSLDVKKLRNDTEAQYRLRVGSYRVKFNRDNAVQIIAIVKIAHRREVYQ